MSQGARVHPDTQRQIVAKLKDGWSASRVAEHFELSETTITRIRAEAGITGRTKRVGGRTREAVRLQEALSPFVAMMATMSESERRGVALRLAARLRDGESLEGVA